MKNQKPSDSVSSPVSLFSHKTADEMMAMDDSEFFDFMEKELEDNSFCSPFLEVKEISNVQEIDIRQKHFDLEVEESQQKISTSVTHTLSSQLTLDPEISSLLAKYPHYVRPPDLPKEVPFGTEVYFYPPMLGLDRNEHLHCLDEYFEYDLPDILRTYPTTLSENLSCSDDHTFKSGTSYIDEPFQRCPVQPRYTIAKTILEGPPTDIIEITDIPPETETERHVGNSFKPDRRIDICAKFLEYLKISDFPFSVDQRKTFVIIDNRILGLRANYTRKDELLLKSDLDLLMNLLANTDYHPVSSTRINRYIADLVSELEFWIERDPIIPTLLPGKIPFFVDPAVYLINKLMEIFSNATEEAIEKSFCAKRKDIHIKLIQLFQTSKFPFTLQQKLLFKELTVAVHATTGNPDSKEEKEFLKIVEKLLHDLNFLDDGPRDGISNPKKVKREFNNFVDALIKLGYEERSFLNEFELFFLNSADLIYHITKVLRFSFIPRYTFPQPRAPN